MWIWKQCRKAKHRDEAPTRGRACRRFLRDEEGSLVIFGVMMLIIMFLAGGLAVDVIRFETTRTQIQNTMDRAVLAAADLSNTQDAKTVVIDYFQKAGLDNYLENDTISVQETQASGQLSFRRVSATAKADVSTMFMRLVGIDDMTAAALSTAEEGITDLEISLVLDVSGSMGWSSASGNSKIYELREAAKDFAFYMQCNPNAERNSGEACSVTDGKVSISTIPYAEQVTVGSTLLERFNDLPALTIYDISDEPVDDSCAPGCVATCVTFEAKDFETSGVMEQNENAPFWELKRTGAFDARSNSNDNTPTNRTCRSDSWREIRPFIEDHLDTIDYIDDLRSGGNTSIDIGMKWGTMLLSPEMRPIINRLTTTVVDGSTVVDSAFSDRPFAFDQTYSMKVIVLMTDGVNTTQYYLNDGFRDGLSEVWSNSAYSDRYSIYDASRDQYYYTHDRSWNDQPYGDGETTVTSWENEETCGWEWRYSRRRGRWVERWVCHDNWVEVTTTESQPGDAEQMTFPDLWAVKPTSWYKQFNWLNDPDGSYNGSTKDDHLDDICTAAKAEGIIVYSIGFEVDAGSNSETVMRNCASTPSHYFAANGANLASIFGQIASSINQLRLIQ